jgi:hypothetical protein
MGIEAPGRSFRLVPIERAPPLSDPSAHEKDALAEAIKASRLPLVDSPPPLDQADEALSLFSQGLHTGKMVLTMRHPSL